MRNKIEGVLTAIVTPFTEEGALHLPGLKRQIQRQLAAENGIFCGGTNGEFFVLTEEEKWPSPAPVWKRSRAVRPWWRISGRSLPAPPSGSVSRSRRWGSMRSR